MDLALFVLRIVVGGYFVGHGAQKLWGHFGGHGLEGTGQFFESLGFKPGRRHAQLAGTSELLGGVLLVLGLITPLAAVLIVSVMTVAILSVHAKNGPFVTDSGYEYNLVLIAIAWVLAASPGSWSIDDALNLGSIHGTAFALGAVIVGAIGGFLAMAQARSGRTAAAPPSTTDEARFERAEQREPAAVGSVNGAAREQDSRPGIPADPR